MNPVPSKLQQQVTILNELSQFHAFTFPTLNLFISSLLLINSFFMTHVYYSVDLVYLFLPPSSSRISNDCVNFQDVGIGVYIRLANCDNNRTKIVFRKSLQTTLLLPCQQSGESVSAEPTDKRP